MILKEEVELINLKARQSAVGILSQAGFAIEWLNEGGLAKISTSTQLAPEAKQFLIEYLTAKELEPQLKTEVLCVFETLLILPSPKDQATYLKRVIPILDQVKARSSLEIRHQLAEDSKVHEAIIGLANTANNVDGYMITLMEFFRSPTRQTDQANLINTTLENCINAANWRSVATFLAEPANQIDREKQIAELFTGIKEQRINSNKYYEHYWITAPLIFFSKKINRELNPELFSDLVTEVELMIQKPADLADDLFLRGISNFLKADDNLQDFSIWADEICKSSNAFYALTGDFFNDPKVWKDRQQIGIELRKQAISSSQWPDLIKQLTNPNIPKIGTLPGEEDYDPNLIKNAVSEMIASQLYPENRLRFFAHPENLTDEVSQDDISDEIEKLLRKGEDDAYMAVVAYFDELTAGQISNSPLIELFLRSVARISDKALRGKALNILRSYLKQQDLPQTLLESLPTDQLPVTIAFKILGVPESVVRSWQLTSEDISFLLPSLIRLIEIPELSKIFENISLPFIPRSINTRQKVVVEKVINWIKKLDFLANLPKELDGISLIKSHLDEITKLQNNFGITAESEKIDLNALRQAQGAVDKMSKHLISTLIRLLRLDEAISFEEFEAFVKAWGGEINSVILLSNNYNKSYDKGLTFLGKKITEIIKGEATNSRYDLKNKLTLHQLEIILKSKPKEIWESIIEVWRSPNFSISITTSEQAKSLQPDQTQNLSRISSELGQRITQSGQFHARELQNLVTQVDGEDSASKIIDLILTNLNENSAERPKNVIGELVQALKSSNLDQNQQKCLIGLAQLFHELKSGLATPEKSAKTIENLIKKINHNWQDLAKTDLVNEDLKVFAINELNAINTKRETYTSTQIYLNYLTDNPKTLLEIGRYPFSGSCQDYESTGSYNHGLPGYVFDSQIQAACVSIIEVPAVLTAKNIDLTSAKIIDVNLNLGTAKLVFPDGKVVDVKVSKPIARRMIILGKGKQSDADQNEVIALIDEGTYCEAGANTTQVEELLSQIIKTKQLQLSTKLGKPVLTNPELKAGNYITSIAGSHNPAGHYNDLSGGLRGGEGEDYTIDKY